MASQARKIDASPSMADADYKENNNPSPRSVHKASKSVSHVATDRALKRLSLNLPSLQTEAARRRGESVAFKSPSWHRRQDSSAEFASDATGFLSALAGQERRVMELKEELAKAESDLTLLKREWASREASKSRVGPGVGLDHVNMSSGTAVFSSSVLVANSNTPSIEERRRAMRISTHGRPANPQRKVFAGGRHTRTLSLLTPTGLEHRKSEFSPVMSFQPLSAREPTLDARPTFNGYRPAYHSRTRTQGTRDDLMNTGKQLVGDLKDGLWTFFEDLKQATVGDEAVTDARVARQNITPRRTQSTSIRGTPRTPSGPAASSGQLIDIDGVVQGPGFKSSKADGSNEDASDDEGWDNWNTPSPACTAKTSESASIASTARSTPRTSVSSDMEKDKPISATAQKKENRISWPALNKLAPGNLSRTASSFMDEWERSLTPQQEKAKQDLTYSLEKQAAKA